MGCHPPAPTTSIGSELFKQVANLARGAIVSTMAILSPLPALVLHWGTLLVAVLPRQNGGFAIKSKQPGLCSACWSGFQGKSTTSSATGT